jgi:hypothetical protein
MRIQSSWKQKRCPGIVTFARILATLLVNAGNRDKYDHCALMLIAMGMKENDDPGRALNDLNWFAESRSK